MCIHTCTHMHTYTNAQNSTVWHNAGVLLTPKSLDLFLAFLFIPPYPAPVTQTWVPRLWQARLGPVPKTAWKQETKEFSGQLGRDTDGAVWLPVTCPPCLTSPTGPSLGQ